MELYKNIKARRMDLGLTQSELAAKLGYADKSMIAKIEKGAVDIPLSKIEAFAHALKTTPGFIMGWEADDTDYIVAYRNMLEPAENDVTALVELFNRLDDRSKDRLLAYAEGLAAALDNEEVTK